MIGGRLTPGDEEALYSATYRDELIATVEAIVQRQITAALNEAADAIEAALLTGPDAIRQAVVEGPWISRLKASSVAVRAINRTT